MAATEEFFKESPDGHANSMGTCYSASKKKGPNSSSFSPKGDARRAQNSTQPPPRSSSTGKASRTQISCFNNFEQTSGRSASTGKDCRTSLANASLTSTKQAHTPCKPTNAASTATAIHARHMSRNSNLSDGKKHDAQTHHTYTNSNVSDTGSASSGFVDGAATAIPTHTDEHHTLASISKAPPLPKFNSLSLKSGIGPYEVLTPRKPMAGLQGMTPRKSGSVLIPSNQIKGEKKIERATQSSLNSPSRTKDQGAKEPCKNCKTSNLDSVCFIANDGRIAAANTGPPSICHFHHCSSPKCTANPNYHPSSSVPCKKVLLSKTRSVPCQPARTNSSNNVSQSKDDSMVCATTSTTSRSENDEDLSKGTQSCREAGHIDAENVCHEFSVPNQGGKEGNAPPSVLMQGVDTQETCSENGYINVLAPLQSSHDAKDGDNIVKSSLTRHEDVQRIDSKASSYHGDNELSCSDDGTDTPTSKRSTKGAFGDLSNMEFAQPDSAKASQARKSSMERMRQKYLDSLKEQEAETVRLKKQEMHARKQAGEWMLDCAMGEILHKLAPDGEAGVKVLVEAFETIMQHSDMKAHHEENAAHECIGFEDASKPSHM